MAMHGTIPTARLGGTIVGPEKPTDRTSRLPLVLSIDLILLPAVVTLFYVTHFGVNVVGWDEFDFVPYLSMKQAGVLTPAALYAQHWEHRILFPRLVMLASASLTQFNTKANMYLYWLCLCGVCGLLFLVYTRIDGISAGSLLLFAPVPLLIFSLRQWDNLLWGWELCWSMMELFAVLAFYVLQSQSRRWLWFFLALINAVIASFSLVTGLSDVGFRCTIPMSMLGKGRHTLIVRIVTADGSAYYQPDYHLTIDVRRTFRDAPSP